MSKRTSIDGLPVLDAKESAVLIINDNDVARADRKEPVDCVVARACRRLLHAKEVHVHLSRVYLRTTGGSWTRYATPPSLRQEIIAYDRGGSFSPGTFTLNPIPPSDVKRRGARAGSPQKQPRKKTGKKRAERHILTDVRSGPF